MSNPWPAGDAIGYRAPSAPPPGSGGVRTVAILGIVYAALGILLRLIFLAFSVWMILDPAALGLEPPTAGMIVSDLFLNVGGIVMGVWLLVSSIALVRLREAGRSWTVVWSVVMLGVVAVSTLLSLAFVEPIVPPTLPAGQESAYRVGHYLGVVGVNLVRCIFPVVCLALLTREKARAAVG